MPRVRFTTHLKRYFPDLSETDVDARTVSEVIAAIDQQHPGLASYLVDERGALRTHVNLFVGGKMIEDRRTLRDEVNPSDEVFVAQALSGG